MWLGLFVNASASYCAFFHMFTLWLFVRFVGFSNASLAQQISRYSKYVTKDTHKLSLPLSAPYSSDICGACFASAYYF